MEKVFLNGRMADPMMANGRKASSMGLELRRIKMANQK